MNQEELERHLQETYNEYRLQVMILEKQQAIVDDLDEQVRDLNIALRVVKDLNAQKSNPHHKDN